jgi:hypothetical protein
MKLTLGQITKLFNELNGGTQENPKGILGQKLSIRAKYILQNELNKKVTEEVKNFEEARLEFFKELGELKDDMYQVTPENQPELIKRINELESVEKNIPVPGINVGELYNIETEEYWPVLLDKLMAKEEPKAEEAEVIPM